MPSRFPWPNDFVVTVFVWLSLIGSLVAFQCHYILTGLCLLFVGLMIALIDLVITIDS